MWLKPLSAVATLLFVFTSFSQSTIDSLENELKGLDPAGKAYLITLTKLAKEYAETDPDSALVICARALQISKNQSADSLSGQILIGFSSAYSYLADYEKSTTYSFKAIETAEKYADTTTLIDGFNNLGIDFMMQEEDDKAVEYFQKVEELSRIFGDSLRWGHALNNLGLMAGYAERFGEELDYYDQAATIFNAIGEKEGYANTLLNSGTAYTILEDFGKADNLYGQALEVFQEIGMTSGVQNTILSWAENLMMSGNLAEAKTKAEQALQIAKEYQFTQDEIYTLELLSEIAIKMRDYELALELFRKAVDIKEEIFTAEKSQQIAELETKYQTEKREQELAIANLQVTQQRLEKYVWIGALVLAMIVGGVFIFSIRQKSKLEQKLLAEEVENLRLKINSLLGDNKALNLDHEQLNQNLHQPLTEREFEILNLTISDKTNQEIAEQVFLSVNTVKYHLKNVYEKLGVSNRKEALHLIVGQS